MSDVPSKMERYDLDMTVDESTWIRENPIYCPVPWCSAHKLRNVRCGDVDGDYEGIHVARILALPREGQRTAKEVEALREMGLEHPELALGILRMTQDAVDQGMLKGHRGRRKLVPTGSVLDDETE